MIIASSTTTTTTTTTATNCIAGWVHSDENGNCYRYMDTKLSWNDAMKSCQSFNGINNGNLASIPDEATNNFLKRFGATKPKWIGGHYFNTGGEWKWSDGTPWSYTNWGSNFPKNTERKYHLSMFSGGRWGNHYESLEPLAYICQYKPTPTATTAAIIKSEHSKYNQSLIERNAD